MSHLPSRFSRTFVTLDGNSSFFPSIFALKTASMATQATLPAAEIEVQLYSRDGSSI